MNSFWNMFMKTGSQQGCQIQFTRESEIIYNCMLCTQRSQKYGLEINCWGLNSGFCLKPGIPVSSSSWILVEAVVSLDKALYPHCLVPWRRLKSPWSPGCIISDHINISQNTVPYIILIIRTISSRNICTVFYNNFLFCTLQYCLIWRHTVTQRDQLLLQVSLLSWSRHISQ